MDHQLDQLPGVALGLVSEVDAAGRPLVAVAGATPQPALCAVAARDWRGLVGATVVVAFVDSDPARPVVLGVLGAAASATGAGAAVPAAATTVAATPRRLRVAAGEELLIECGKSSIHLRADGRIEIRGEHLVSRSRGPNKIKGGTVHLN